MKNLNKFIACLSVTIACLAGISQSAYASVAGHVQFVSGDVQITSPAGQTRQAQKGDAISEGDTLTSALSASAQIKMQDGGFVAVRPDTKLKFDEFVFAGKQDGSEKSFFSLFKGGFRAVTGLIGQINKQNYKITTPAATIGIRGTDHETFLIVPGSPLAQIAPSGAYSKVNVGETFMATEKGTIFVQPNQMGFAGGMNQAPQLQPLNTKIFTVAAAPTAGAKEKKEEKKEEKAGAKQEQKNAKNDKEEKQEEKKGGGKDSKQADKGNGEAKGDAAPQEPAAPLRVAAVVDAVPPSAGLIQPVVPVVTPLPIFFTQIVQPPVIPPQLPIVQPGGTPVVTPVVTVLTAIPADNRIAWELGGWWWGQALSAPADVTPFAAVPTFTDRYGMNSIYLTSFIMTGATGASALSPALPSGIQYGSWANVSAPTFTDFYPFGPGGTGMAGSPWIYGPMGYRDVSTPITGTFSYTLDGATAPTNFRTGVAGTLNVGSVTLTANFTASTVDIALGLTHAGTVWGATAVGMPISTVGNGSFAAAMVVTQGGLACPNCWGNVQGGFTGWNFVGAIAQYSLWDGISNGGVDGAVAFVRGAGVVTNTTAQAGLGFAVYDQFGWAGNVATVTNPAGVLTGYTSPGQNFSVACGAVVGCTGALATNAATGAITGINLGTWSNGTVTWSGSGTPGPQHWITGPVAGPAYLPEVLVGTVTYNMSGGSAPTGIYGTGTLNSVSLTVNFTQQTVAVALSATVPGINAAANTYVVSTPAGGEAPLNGTMNSNVNSAFWFNAVTCVGCTGTGTVTVTGGGGAVSGYIGGQLTGQGLTGAILSYQLFTTADTIMGVAALGLSAGTPINTATSYRLAAAVTPANLFQGNGNGLVGGYSNSTRAIFDAAANLTQFDANTNGWPKTLSIAGATVAERGADPISGISWGRWTGGTQTNVDRTLAPGTPGASLSQATPASGVHWIAGPNMTAAVDLPISGTFNYVLAGGTLPTDQAGITGTLQSATLSANFTAMTVNTGVTVAMPTATITANATGLPITNGFFGGDSKLAAPTGVTSSVTCAGVGCGAVGTHSAKVDGVFTGAGGIGAAVLYGLQTGTMTVGGVAAFHR